MADVLELVGRLCRDDDVDSGAIDRVRGAWRASASSANAESLVGGAMQPVVPYLIYDDVERAVTWLSEAFGFRELLDARFVDGAGAIQHAELELFGALVMMGPPSIHGESPRRGVSSMLDVGVPDVDAHYRRARAAGASIVIDIEDTPWGTRRYQASDLEGHQWQFSQPTAVE